MDIVSTVFTYTKRIRNGRTIPDILRHLKSEVEELSDEVEKFQNRVEAGSDGIDGECVDVINCALDLFIEQNSTLTKEEILNKINSIMVRKCDKWEKYYTNSIDKAQTNA